MRCLTEEQTRLYERGYPHMVTLVDGHRDDKKADPSKIYARKYYGEYHVQWPRKVAEAFVRTHGGDSEPRAALEQRLAKPRRQEFHSDAHFLFCAEALIGTDAALETLVGALCNLPEERWPAKGSAFDPATKNKPELMIPAIHRMNVHYENGNTGYFGYLAGYLLLRASPDVATQARATLEDLWSRARAKGVDPIEETLHGGLDLALHGAEGARRVVTDSHWQYLHWWGFVDDAALFHARFKAKDKSEWDPDPRHIWMCPEILDYVFQKKIVKRLADRRPRFLEDVGMFDDPRVELLMREWKDDKKAGAVAARWLEEHG